MKIEQEKYKYTKQLLKLAIEAGGYTNKDIAKKARLSEKSVKMPSLWRNGKAQATVVQMNYFIQNYEHLLKRKIEHLFYTQTLENEVECLRFKKLTGEILFKYQIKVKVKDSHGRTSDKAVSSLRIVIIKQGDKYHLVQQFRAGILSLKQKEVDEKYLIYPVDLDFVKAIKSDNEDGNWFYYSTLENIDFDKVVRVFQAIKDDLLEGENVVDIAHGYPTHSGSKFFNGDNIYPMEFAFYQTVMKMNLHSELLPF